MVPVRERLLVTQTRPRAGVAGTMAEKEPL